MKADCQSLTHQNSLTLIPKIEVSSVPIIFGDLIISNHEMGEESVQIPVSWGLWEIGRFQGRCSLMQWDMCLVGKF